MAQDAEKFILDLLKEKHPDLDTRPGTGIRDTLIRPFVGIIDRLLSDIEELRNNSDLQNHKTLDPVVLDKRASNWFIERDTGGKSTGFARVFLSQQDDIEIREGHKFVYGADKLIFLATDTTTVLADSLTVGQITGEWYFDVNLESVEEGSQYNIEPGQFIEFDPINPSVLRVESIETFVNGKDVEDNVAFYNRLKEGITVRNLINEKSIKTVLMERKDFSIKDVYVAGFGSPEQWRDYITGSLGSFHIGNMTDIYIKKDIITKTKTYTVDVNQKVVFDAADLPIYRIKSFNGSTAGLPVLSFNTDYLSRFGKDEDPYIQTVLAQGTTVEVVFDTIDMDAVDTFVRKSDERVTTASILTRGLAPVYVSFDLQYTLKDGAAPIDEAALLSAVKGHINDLKIGSALEVSDIGFLARTQFDDIDRIVMPLTLNGKLFDFTNTETNFSSQDALVVAEDTAKSLSQRTVIYIADAVTVSAA